MADETKEKPCYICGKTDEIDSECDCCHHPFCLSCGDAMSDVPTPDFDKWVSGCSGPCGQADYCLCVTLGKVVGKNYQKDGCLTGAEMKALIDKHHTPPKAPSDYGPLGNKLVLLCKWTPTNPNSKIPEWVSKLPPTS